MSKVIQLICVFLLCFQGVLAQTNMVLNSSFEKLDSTGTWAQNWSKINSVDFFHANNSNKYKRTFFWPDQYKKTPKQGEGYVGLWTNNELLIGRCKPLKANQKYRIELWVCTMRNKTPTSDLWVSVSRKIKVVKDYKLYFNLRKSLSNSPTNFIESIDEWQFVSAEFVANGGEINLAVSCISPTPKFKNGVGSSKGAYVFLDAIAIVEIPNEISVPKLNTPLRLKNVYFKSGKATLLPESYPELDKWYMKLKAQESVKVEISGHTDNVGDSISNKQLSESRAKAVRDYFIQKGFLEKRLSYFGYGSGKPISENKTEKGRRKNRRVELRIIKQKSR